MKRTILLLFLPFPILAQPEIQWQSTLGGTLYDDARKIEQTNDGGYFISGHTVSDDGDVIGNHGQYDFWAIKTDSLGGVLWKRAYGGSGEDWAFGGSLTADGGYVMTGYTTSNDGDVSGNHGDRDAWIIKLNLDGDIEWQKCLGGSKRDEAWDVLQCPDGTYLLIGSSGSLDGDVVGNHGSLDYWVVKLNVQGDLLWEKSYGGSDIDTGYALALTGDGGFIVVGEAQSTDGQMIDNIAGVAAWVVKLNFEGKIEWQKALGGSGIDRANDIIQTRDGGYMLMAQTGSNNGDVSGNHGGYDYWAVKLRSSGEIEWQRTLGGTSEDYGRSIRQTSDGGYIAAGTVNSNNGDISGNHGSSDLWAVKLSESGDIQWQKAFGGTLQEGGFCVRQTADEGFVLAGTAWSNNGDVSGVLGKTDCWILKLGPEISGTTELSTLPLVVFPNPAEESVEIRLPEGAGILHVTLADMPGHLIVEYIQPAYLTQLELNISALPKGLYFLRATGTDGKVYAGKLLKN